MNVNCESLILVTHQSSPPVVSSLAAADAVATAGDFTWTTAFALRQ